MKDKVVLIGMPGCGKTTIGKVLATDLNYNFFDMDDYIEEIAQKSIKELFEEGEEYFREWETKACKELVCKKKCIISSGGGVIKKDINIDILKENCIIVFVNRPIENIVEDVDVASRPLLKDGKEKIYKLFDERYDKYKKACHIEIKNEGYLMDTLTEIEKSLKDLLKK